MIKMSPKQLKLLLKINYLILALFIVCSGIYYLNKQGLPPQALEPLNIQQYPVKVIPSSPK